VPLKGFEPLTYRLQGGMPKTCIYMSVKVKANFAVY
jgi:hypothetical protein